MSDDQFELSKEAQLPNDGLPYTKGGSDDPEAQAYLGKAEHLQSVVHQAADALDEVRHSTERGWTDADEHTRIKTHTGADYLDDKVDRLRTSMELIDDLEAENAEAQHPVQEF